LFAVGLAGGAFTVYFCNVSNSAAKSLRQTGKAASAFQRATEFVYDTSFAEAVHRRDCKEDIGDVKFSPNGKMLAVASHDGFIDIYSIRYKQGNLQAAHGDICVKYLKRLRGHSSAVLHIDWSEDNRLLQSTCGANEILYWDVAEGKQLLSSNDCIEGDTNWESESCHLGFAVMGIWGGGNQKGTDINSVDVSRGLGVQRTRAEKAGPGPVVATGDDHGRLHIFNYPCVVKNAPHLTRVGHSSHIMDTKWLESSGEGLLGTVGGNDMSCIVWHVKAL
jgi:WD40 repeat protein